MDTARSLIVCREPAMTKTILSIFSVFLFLFIVLNCGGGGSSSNNNTDNSNNDGGNDTTINAEKFTPPSGSCSSGDPESPCPRRILLANSTDGKTYQRKGVLLTDQANTPNMIQLASGRIIVYYTGSYLDVSNPSNPRDAIAAAVSDDEGVTWEYYKLSFTGFGEGPPIVDPDIIALEDGTFRMYVTRGIGSGNNAKVVVLWADSDDGFNFIYGGIAAERESSIVDSLTYKIGSAYHMYILNPTSNGSFSYFTSTNGKTFTYISETEHKIGSETYILSNWLPEDNGTYRIFGFTFPNANIASFTTTDGATLTPGSDIHLTFSEDSTGLEKTWIKDAAVIKLKNNSYLMAYVAEIP